jgi:flagellin-like protein
MKKAEIGIGTLIIFIAMILVAAIAASVLIQTATSLQNQALLTGDRAKGSISSGVEALVIYGMDGSDGDVENFTMKVKLIAGSDTLRFNDTMVELMTKNMSQEMQYGGIGCGNSNGNSTHYFIDHILEASGHRDGYLLSGEVVMICIDGPYSLTRDEDISFSVVGSTGFPLTIDTAMPDYIHTTRVFIFP